MNKEENSQKSNPQGLTPKSYVQHLRNIVDVVEEYKGPAEQKLDSTVGQFAGLIGDLARLHGARAIKTDSIKVESAGATAIAAAAIEEKQAAFAFATRKGRRDPETYASNHDSDNLKRAYVASGMANSERESGDMARKFFEGLNAQLSKPEQSQAESLAR